MASNLVRFELLKTDYLDLYNLHHVTDVLPILGLTAAAAFLAEYQTAFMLFGLATTLAGIGWMLVVLLRERRKVIAHAAMCGMAASHEAF